MIRTFAKQLLSVGLSSLLVVTAYAIGSRSTATRGTHRIGRGCRTVHRQTICSRWWRRSPSIRTRSWPRFSAPQPFQTRLRRPTMASAEQAAHRRIPDEGRGQADMGPSVKALTQFPSVLDNMAKNLSWTSALGEAYHNQAADVMAAVQVLRPRQKRREICKSGSQITVVQESPQVIVIQPANPQVVYVPQYNPTVVYGVPYQPPGYIDGRRCGRQRAGVSESASRWALPSTTVAADGDTAPGIATGTAPPWCIAAAHTTAMLPGTAGTTDRAQPRTVPTAPPVPARGYNPSTGTYARGASATTAIRKRGRRPGLQPAHRSVCLHRSGLKRLWERWSLDGQQERQDRLYPASVER